MRFVAFLLINFKEIKHDSSIMISIPYFEYSKMYLYEDKLSFSYNYVLNKFKEKLSRILSLI